VRFISFNPPFPGSEGRWFATTRSCHSPFSSSSSSCVDLSDGCAPPPQTGGSVGELIEWPISGTITCWRRRTTGSRGKGPTEFLLFPGVVFDRRLVREQIIVDGQATEAHPEHGTGLFPEVFSQNKASFSSPMHARYRGDFDPVGH